MSEGGLTMMAIVLRKYGSADDLELREIERPAIGDDGVLVRVRAASVNPIDWRAMRGEPYALRKVMGGGLRRPTTRVLGVDVAGHVEAVGRAVTEFRSGDEVLGFRSGSLAEYVAGTERNFVPKPARLTFEQAAAVPVSALTALQALRDKGHVRAGQRVLIDGASGGVGTFAVQLAKAYGAHVTGVCSTRNVEMVRSLGADQVVDYTVDDFTRRGERYDLILDVAADRSLLALKRVLAPNGTLVMVGAPRVVGSRPSRVCSGRSCCHGSRA